MLCSKEFECKSHQALMIFQTQHVTLISLKISQDSTDNTMVCHINKQLTLAALPPTSHQNWNCTKPVLFKYVNIAVR